MWWEGGYDNNNTPWGPFYSHELIQITALMSNYTHRKAWNKISYPFVNLDDAAVEVWNG